MSPSKRRYKKMKKEEKEVESLSYPSPTKGETGSLRGVAWVRNQHEQHHDEDGDLEDAE